MQLRNVRSAAFGFIGAAVFWAVSHSGPAVAQIQVLPAFVRLQASTPGTAQTGHANVTGTVIAGQFVGGGTALTGLSANNVTNGLLAPAFGGTGLNTVATPTGSLLLTTATGTWGTMPVGSEGRVFKVASGAPIWGIDSLTLPYSATVSSGVAVSISSSSGSDVFDAVITNSGSGAECFQGDSNGNGNVIEGNMTGTGHAGLFTFDNPSGANSALEVTHNGSGQSLKASMFGTGTAARFSSSLLGTTVDVCGPKGSVDTNGFYYRDYTATQRSAAVPIAYGCISSAGTVSSGTGNFSVTHTVAGDYDVTVNGEIYSNTGYTVTILPISNAARMTCVADGGTPFLVHMFDATGTKIDTGFQFTIWRTDAVE